LFLSEGQHQRMYAFCHT